MWQLDKMAAKPVTNVQDCVSIVVNMKSLDTFDKMLGHCPAMFMTKLGI